MPSSALHHGDSECSLAMNSTTSALVIARRIHERHDVPPIGPASGDEDSAIRSSGRAREPCVAQRCGGHTVGRAVRDEELGHGVTRMVTRSARRTGRVRR